MPLTQGYEDNTAIKAGKRKVMVVVGRRKISYPVGIWTQDIHGFEEECTRLVVANNHWKLKPGNLITSQLIEEGGTQLWDMLCKQLKFTAMAELQHSDILEVTSGKVCFVF